MLLMLYVDIWLIRALPNTHPPLVHTVNAITDHITRLTNSLSAQWISSPHDVIHKWVLLLFVSDDTWSVTFLWPPALSNLVLSALA